LQFDSWSFYFQKASCLHIFAFVIEQHKLVLVKDWCPISGKATIGCITLTICHRLKWFIHLLGKWSSNWDRTPCLCCTTGLSRLCLFLRKVKYAGKRSAFLHVSAAMWQKNRELEAEVATTKKREDGEYDVVVRQLQFEMKAKVCCVLHCG